MISGSVVFSGLIFGGMPGGRFSSSAMPEWKNFDVRIAGIDAIVPADGATVNENDVDRCVDAIVSAARTGKIGEGKIFVTNVERVVRIRTGEEDEAAV